MIVGNEYCDDGDETDDVGCTADCSGVIIGYICDPLGTLPALR